MWQVVYIATDETEANEIRDSLIREGFLVKIEAVDDGGYQIKVPEIEAEDVYQFLSEYY